MAIKRLHYFNGQFLREQDFTDEQKYHLDMRRRLNQRLHMPGIVFGLEVNPGANKVTVQPGMAIDAQGREIILESATDLTITAAADITIAYKEEQTDESSETGIVGNRRWTESAGLANAADPDGIVLAKVSTVSPVALNNAFRRPYSAPVVLGDLEVKRDLTIQGNLTVQGETTTVQTDKMRGNVILGDEDVDTVTVEGRLVTGHSSNRLQIASPLQIAGDVAVTGALALAGALSITAPGTGLSVTNNAFVGGSVGIGTATPDRKLTLAGAGASTEVFANLKNDTHEILMGVDNAAVVSAMTNSDLQLRTNNAMRVIVKANTGNVGIGTTNPTRNIQTQTAINQYSYSQTDGTIELATFLNGGFQSGMIGTVTNHRFQIYTSNQGPVLTCSPGGTNGSVGIGTESPNGRLDVANLVRFGLDEGGSGPRVITFGRLAGDEGNAGKIAFRPSWDATVLGIVGAGTIPNRRVRIWDDLIVDNEAFKPGGGSWTVFSDRRLKKDVKPLRGSLDQLLKLRGVTYQWKEPEKFANRTGTQVGLLADEVEQVFPDWVGSDSGGYKTLTIRGFEALTIEALREMQQADNDLKNKTRGLESRLHALEKKLAID